MQHLQQTNLTFLLFHAMTEHTFEYKNKNKILTDPPKCRGKRMKKWKTKYIEQTCDVDSIEWRSKRSTKS